MRSDTPPEPALTAALAAMLPPAQATAFFQADLTAVVRGMPDDEAAIVERAARRRA
ncbi:hypothetical protein ACIG5D_18105 [Microbispora rosea]|uniref:hypothetical protein n=1 Tax=Microbispora rosea TaxID=58117 RepID=UPI00343DD930